MMREILKLREEIEGIDREIVGLLDRRMALVEKLGRLKAKEGLPLRDLERERDLLERLSGMSLKALRSGELQGIYRIVFAQSVLRQRELLHRGPNPFPICVSVLASSKEEAERMIEEVSQKAEMVELRIDSLGDALPEIPQGLPLVLTNRKREEGGFFEGSERERVRRLKEATLALRPRYVDLEASTPEDLKEEILEMGVDVILSQHDFSQTPPPEELLARLDGMICPGSALYKVVTMAQGPEDSLKVLLFLAEAKRRGHSVVGHAMGEHGRLSRILGPFFGASFVYASAGKGKEAAPGQMTPEELREGWMLLGRWLNG